MDGLPRDRCVCCGADARHFDLQTLFPSGAKARFCSAACLERLACIVAEARRGYVDMRHIRPELTREMVEHARILLANVRADDGWTPAAKKQAEALFEAMCREGGEHGR